MVAPAQAAGATYTGKSTQGLGVSLKTRANGRPRLFTFAWETQCPKGRVFSVTRATPGSSVSYRRFTSQGSYIIRQKGGIRASVAGSARGKRTSAHGWGGSFRLSIVVRKNGHVIDRCHLGRTAWKAARP
ncbi:MAG: hypothetical protein M3Z33_07385 [Actinomycetota bacterium]|nr:hypothetical protein [Actinomycetota bacterium]